MSVTRKGKTLVMTADADAYTGVALVSGMTLQVAGGSSGDRLRVTDTGGGIVADYLVAATQDNADLWNGREPQWCDGLLVEDFPSGTAVLTVFLS